MKSTCRSRRGFNCRNAAAPADGSIIAYPGDFRTRTAAFFFGEIAGIVREDAQELFGFETWDERQTFIVLTSISKVGARTALGILSAFRPDDLRRLVLEDDVLALTQVSGIGKKSAQHIFLELKYKLKVEDMPAAASLQLGVPGSVYRDALTGLEGLGYAEAEAAPVLKNILHEEPDLEVSEALRAALKALARERQK